MKYKVPAVIALLLAGSMLAGCQPSGPELQEPGAGGTGQDPRSSGTALRQDAQCPEGSKPMGQKMSSGGHWSLCFSVEPKLGMVLQNVAFAPPGAEPIELISSMSLAQLEVPYDDGARMTSDITSAGFGGTKMQTLGEVECTGNLLAHGVPTIGDGSRFGTVEHRPVLCSDLVDAGLSYRSGEIGQLLAKRKDDWQLSTISKVGWYEYINQVTFGADGSIRPSLGATGDLSPAEYSDAQHGSAVGPGDEDHASSHSHNAVWKIDWNLGGETGQQISQYDTAATGTEGKHSPIVQGTYSPIDSPATANSKSARWWKVAAPQMLNADQHPMSYEINLGKTDSFTFVDDQRHHGEDRRSDIGYDVAFTNKDQCHIFATYNRGDCGRGVLDYVQQQAGDQLDDVISWVAVGYHHVPRDEDQSPMEVHWQGFDLLPRDLTAQRVDAPEPRKGLNGKPENWEGQMPPEEH